MEKRLTFKYDRPTDILYIDKIPPYPEQETEELVDDVIARLNPVTGEIENLEVLFFPPDDVGYGQAQYIVEKFGEPTAAIVSIEDFYLLQAARQERASASFRDLVANIRERGREVDPGELSRLIEEARAEFHSLHSRQPDAD